MTAAQVVETSVTVNNNSPIQDYVRPDDQTQPFEMTPGFKLLTVFCTILCNTFKRKFLLFQFIKLADQVSQQSKSTKTT